MALFTSGQMDNTPTLTDTLNLLKLLIHLHWAENLKDLNVREGVGLLIHSFRT